MVYIYFKALTKVTFQAPGGSVNEHRDCVCFTYERHATISTHSDDYILHLDINGLLILRWDFIVREKGEINYKRRLFYYT